MKNIFQQVELRRPPMNTFDLSHDRKMSLKMGELVPICVMECVPGDTFHIQVSSMSRMAPLIAPIMHQLTVYKHFFFVPNRILWANWEDFITGGEDGQDATAAPYLNYRGTIATSLTDYMGLPDSSGAENVRVSALPFAAYNKIYNEYYRDQNLITEVRDALLNGDNSANFGDFTTIRKRAWMHDYFTSALPWTQKGPEATIPLGSTAPVVYADPTNNNLLPQIKDQTTGALYSGNIDVASGFIRTSGGGTLKYIDPVSSLETDLSSATAATIIDLRNAFRLQEWLEKNARGGSRYIESIYAHFGVKSPDARLQRPEFLGGGTAKMAISEVLQTSESATGGNTPQANMAGHGIAVGGSTNFRHYCHEHGYIIGIMSIMPKTAYQQGFPKHFLKLDKFDYYWPEFAHIGEQPIENKELFYTSDNQNDAIFGYTPRYAEYKYVPSTVHGEFRSSLNTWHMGRIFATRPALNQSFIECDATTRIFAVTEDEQIYSHVFNRVHAKRPMPYFGNPTF